MSEIKPGCYILQPITPISAPNIQLLIQLLQGDFPLPSPLLLTHISHAQTLRKTPKRYRLSTHPHPPKPPSETSSQVAIGSSEMEHPRPLQRGYS